MPLLLRLGFLLVLVLVDSLSTEDPVEYFLKADPVTVAGFYHEMNFFISFKELVKATEDAAAEHHDALFQSGSDQLLFVHGLAAASSLHQ